MSVQEDVEHGPSRVGGALLDGLYSGGGPPSLLEPVRLGPKAQLRSSYDLGLLLHFHPEGTNQIPTSEYAVPIMTPDHPDKGG